MESAVTDEQCLGLLKYLQGFLGVHEVEAHLSTVKRYESRDLSTTLLSSKTRIVIEAGRLHRNTT